MKFKITFLTLMLSVLTIFTFVSCADTVNNDEEKIEEVDTTVLKVALYTKVLGTWELTGYDYFDETSIEYGYGVRDTVIFETNSITIGEDVFDFNPSTDIYFEEEVPENWRWSGETFYFYVNNKYYSVLSKSDDFIVISFPYWSEINNCENAVSTDFVRVKTNNGGSVGTLDFSVEGDWKYTISAGNTKTTFSINNDGTFTFKKNSDVTNGSYSLNGNKVTFSFEKGGQEIEDTFTISGSEDAITLTLVESKTVTGGQESTGTALSNMLLSFYTIIDTSITLSK